MNRWCFTRDVGFMEDKEGPWVRFEEIKPQLTLKELRDQFEESGDYDFNKQVANNPEAFYNDFFTEECWLSYIACAKANNILREPPYDK